MPLLPSILTGVKWSSISQFGRQILQLVTTIVLARTLAPSDFGLMSMAMVVVGFLNVFRDLGTSSAIIQRNEISGTLLSGIFWLNVIFGIVVMSLVFVLAPLFASFYGEARLVPILKALSASFFISSIGISHQALLERELQFEKLAKAEISSTLFGAVVGITLAIRGAGVWSLVAQALSTALLSSTLLSLVLSRWKPRLVFSVAEIKSVARFSLNLSGFNMTNYFIRNADSLLIGKYLGAQDLGYYVLAYRIVLYPWQNVTSVISRVMFPVYSKLNQDNMTFRRAYLNVASTIAAIAFPMMLGLIGVSSPLVHVFFGDQWRTVSSLIVILAPIGLLQSIDSTTGSIYLAKSRTDWMFRWGIATGISGVAAFVIGLHWGVIGVATGYLIASLIWLYPGLAIPFSLIGLSILELLKKVWRPFSCAALMLAVIFALKASCGDWLTPVETLIGLLLSGISVYLLCSLVLNRESMKSIISYIRQA
ncbi:MAG TPA: MOP flippase family protein [Bacteroidota bacterium]|nr:MOP flippase family protein [Bacteroidota bacterium]